MSENQLAQLVRNYFQSHELEGMTLDVMEKSIHQNRNWWYVPVRLHHPITKTYGYYAYLTDVEEDIQDNEHLNVILVPA